MSSDVRTRQQTKLRGLRTRSKKKQKKQQAERKRQQTIAAQKQQQQRQQQQPQQQPQRPRQQQQQQQRQPIHLRAAVKRKASQASADASSDSEYEATRPPLSKRRQIVMVDAAAQTDVVQELQQRQMSHTDMLGMQLTANLTGRQLISVCRDVREGTSQRFLFAPNFPAMITKRNKMYAPYFKVIQMHSDELGASVWASICHDVGGLLSHLQRLHQRPINTVHLGADAGQEFLKIDFTIDFGERDLDATAISSHDSTIRDHSRRRVIVVACVPVIKETHCNLKHLFDIISFPTDVRFIFIADLKLDNLVLGLAAPGATCGCCYCERKLTQSSNKEAQFTAGTLRSYNNIMQHCADFTESKDANAAAPKHCSCPRQPLQLFARVADTPFLHGVVAPPGLHLLLGANWLIAHIELLYADVSVWWRRYNFVRPPYHGGDFEGNQIRHLLRSDSIEALRVIMQSAPAQISHRAAGRRSKKPTILLLFNCLVAFADVVTACFGTELRDNWQRSLSIFRRRLLLLPAAKFKRITTKFHIICCHVEPWCLRMRGGLANWHEQSLEAVHRDFHNLWQQSYAITDCTAEKFGSQLLACTLAFNARHTPIS